MQKYFNILEIDRSASIEDVEKAYKELIDAWCPEKFQNIPPFRRKAEIKQKEITDAYEQIRFFLQVKAPDESRKEQEGKLPFENGLARTRHEKRAFEGVTRPPVRKPLQKSLLFGFIAILAVFGALMLYLGSDRKKTATKSLQAPDGALKQKSGGHLNTGTETGGAGVFSADKGSASGQSAVNVPLQRKRAEYIGLLSIKALSKYNRNPVRVKEIQNGLITIGYDTGPIDGVIGPLTIAALQRFAGDRGYVIETGGPFAPDFTGAVLVFAEVAAAHPDWDQILISEDFARWLGRQEHFSAARVAKLKKSASARQVIELLDLYKSDRKLQ